MKKIISFLSLILMFLFQGCTGKEPAKEEIIGTWVASDGGQFQFNEDGTFTGKSLPVDLLWLPDYKGQELNGNGTWKIQKGQGRWEIYLGFDRTTIDNLRDGFGTRLYISGEGLLENNPPWKLFLWKGEEGGERYTFTKE